MELNNFQAEKIEMFNNRRTFINVTDNRILLDSVDVVKNKILAIEATRVLLDKGINKKLADTSGDSPQKKATKDKVIKTLGNKARACAVYFEENELLTQAATLKKTKSFYVRQKDEDIASVIDGARSILFAYKTQLIGYGTTDSWFVILDGQITTMLQWLNAPSSGRESQYAGDADIDKYIGITDTQYDQLDMLVINAFEEDNEDFVNAFLATSSQTSHGVRHNVVEVSMKKLPGLAAINQGKIELKDTVTNEIVKIIMTDAYGLANFNCENKPFYAFASADGCVAQTRLFKPVYRGTFHLDFEMSAV